MKSVNPAGSVFSGCRSMFPDLYALSIGVGLLGISWAISIYAYSLIFDVVD